MSLPSTTPRPTALAAWLRVLVIALLVALAVPALAMADEGDPGTATASEEPAATAAGEPAPVTEEPAPPAAEQPAPPVAEEPAPVEPTPPPAEETPAPAEEPVAEAPPAEPQAPPATTDPAPPAPPVDVRPPVISLPEIEIPPLPSIPELLPGDPAIPGAGVAPVPGIGELAPVLAMPVAPTPPSLGPPSTLPRVSTPAVAPVIVADQAADPLTVATLGGPPILQGGDPISEAAREAVQGTAVLAAAAVPLRGGFVTLDPDRAAVLPVEATPASPATEAFAGGEAEFPAPQVVSPGGPAPSQSLLAVLAAYILPGSGPVPASTIMVLVMLGLILVAVFAPRLGGSERIWSSGRVGPRVGHGVAVRRPG